MWGPMAILKHIPQLLLVLLLSCSGGRELMEGERHRISHIERPAWVDAPELAVRQEGNAFPGMSMDSPTEDAARESAHENARRQAVALVGHEVEVLVDRVIGPPDVNNGLLSPSMIRDGLARMVDEGIPGEEVLKWYIERWESREEGALRKSFRAYCLLEVPRSETRRFLAGLLETRAQDTDDPSVHVSVGLALQRLGETPDAE